jgi:CheY-like chemotaxis protein
METLMQQLHSEGYETAGAASLDELDDFLRKGGKNAAAVIDLSGFDQAIWERCDRLKEAKIPFIVVAPQRSPSIQRDSMAHGASGLLVKPVAIKDMVEHVHTIVGD